MHNKGGGVHLKHFFYEKICTLEKKLVPLHPKNCLPCDNNEAAALLLLFKDRHQTLFPPFPFYLHIFLVKIQIAQFEVRQFTDTQSA